MVSYDLPDLLLGCAGEPLRGRDARARVHAHIERSVEAEAEAAGGVVELRRGHAQVEQDAVGRRDAGAGSQLGEPAEAPVQHAKTPVTDLSSRGHRLRITIERDEPPCAPQLRQDRAAVAAATERAVDVATVAPHLQSLYCLLQQDRGM